MDAAEQYKMFYNGGKASENFVEAHIDILFSVNDYRRNNEGGADKATTTYIDAFFDQLNWDNHKEESKELAGLNWATLLNKLNLNERWVYSGSLTELPCKEKVY